MVDMEVWSMYLVMFVGGIVKYFGMVFGVDIVGFKFLIKDLNFMVRWNF